MLPVLLFLLGVVFGTSISRVMKQLAERRDLPTVDGTPNSVRLWHHGKVIELTPDATRLLANDLLRRAEETEFPGILPDVHRNYDRICSPGSPTAAGTRTAAPGSTADHDPDATQSVPARRGSRPTRPR